MGKLLRDATLFFGAALGLISTVCGMHTTPAKKKKARPAHATTLHAKPARIAAPMPLNIDFANGEIPLVATGACVLDALTGDEIFKKNPDQELYPASTTKILTA